MNRRKAYGVTIISIMVASLIFTLLAFPIPPLKVQAEDDWEYISETVKTQYVGEGVYEAVISGGPEAYWDGDQYTEINSTIVRLPLWHPMRQQYGFLFGVEAGIWKFYAGDAGVYDWDYAFEYKGYLALFKFSKFVYLDSRTWEYETLKNPSISIATLDDNKITWNNIYSQADIEIVYENGHLKENLIVPQSVLDSLPSPYNFGYNPSETWVTGVVKADLTSLHPEVDGADMTGNNFSSDIGFELKNSLGDLISFFPFSLAVDNDGDIQQVKWRVDVRGGSPYIAYGVPYSWISNATGPVLIDPTSTFTGEAIDGRLQAIDAFWPPTTISLTAGQTYSYVAIMKEGTFKIYRTYLSFDSSALSGETVLSAILSVMIDDIRDDDGIMDDIQVWANGQPIWGVALDTGDWGCGTDLSGAIAYGAINNGFYNNITVTAADINTEGQTQFEIKNSDETTEPAGIGYVQIRTAEHANKPKLYVTYQLGDPPVNEALTITNMDNDGEAANNNLYAQYRNYTFQAVASDPEGFANFAQIDILINQTAANRAIFRYTEATNVFSTIAGDTEFELNTATSTHSKVGDTITLGYEVGVEGDATEEADIELEMQSLDDDANSDSDVMQTNYADIVTGLTDFSFDIDDDRGDPGQSITASGQINYIDDPGSVDPSAFYPADDEFTAIVVHNVTDTVEGSDNTVVNGAWSGVTFTASNTIAAHEYHPYADMADADWADADAGIYTDLFIVDELYFRIDDVRGFTVTGIPHLNSSAYSLNDNANLTYTVEFTPGNPTGSIKAYNIQYGLANKSIVWNGIGVASGAYQYRSIASNNGTIGAEYATLDYDGSTGSVTFDADGPDTIHLWLNFTDMPNFVTYDERFYLGHNEYSAEQTINFTIAGTDLEIMWVAGTGIDIILIDEDTLGPFDLVEQPASTYSVNVTAHYEDTYVVFVNMSSFEVFGTPTLAAKVMKVSDSSIYWRYLIPSTDPQNMYLVDTDSSDIQAYSIVVSDLIGRYTGAITRLYIGDLEIHSAELDAQMSLLSWLTPGKIYTIEFVSGSSTYEAGILYADPNVEELTVKIGEINLDSGLDRISDYIGWTCIWADSDTITVRYLDNLTETTNVRVLIQFFNATTGAWEEEYNTGHASSDLTVNHDVATNSTVAHYVNIFVDHVTFGDFETKQIVRRTLEGGRSVVFDLPTSVLGLNALIPGLQYGWLNLISVGFIIITAVSFGQRNANFGTIVISVLALYLWVIGWLPGGWLVFSTCLVIAVIGFLRSEEVQAK